MSIKKTVAIAAAAGALAAISVPAMALENEFHGSYTFNSIFSNIQNGWVGNYAPQGKPENQKMNNYFDQRARLQYIAKTDVVKLVTQFELDTRFGGITDGKYTNTSDAGVLDSDGINFETKHVYLDANLGQNFNLKTGIMPYKDTLKGVFIDADVPAILTTTKLGAYTLGLGFSRFNEIQQSGTNTTNRLGDRASDLFILDNTFSINKDTKAAFSYYFLADYKQNNIINGFATVPAGTNTDAMLLHTFGLSGESKIGPATLSGFIAMQAGHVKYATPAAGTTGSAQLHGWAANVAAKAAVGPGTAKTAFLFTSGNNSTNGNHYKGWITPLNTYNESGMMILTRNTGDAPTTSDMRIRRTIQNVALLTMGYDANVTKQVFVNGNVGFGWTPASEKDGRITGTANYNSSDFMGTELNLEAGYKVSDNMSLSARAAYMILGGLYKGTASNSTVASSKDPENPYTLRLLAKFAF